ncbi:hypothetical protein OpiT1DRAFT_02257 [Opitutaceae bacterium TAV1]|nr:hypothetical protein OpiT1DRAFT_02257 [Opitutaceae bacterium TAV1]
MKALTLVLSILALLGAAASAWFYYDIGDKLKNEIAAHQKTTEEKNGLAADLKKTSDDLAGTKKRLAEENSRHGDTKSQLASEKARTTQLNRDLAQAREQFAAKERSEAQLKQDVTKLREQLVAIRLNTEGGNTEDKAKIAALEEKVKEYEDTLNKSQIAASGGAAATEGVVSRMINTAVASVGSKNAFVVLDLGNKQGATVGQLFAIKRDGNEIARARVSSVQEDLTIAQVEPKSIRTGIQKGDTASIITVAAKTPAPAAAGSTDTAPATPAAGKVN